MRSTLLTFLLLFVLPFTTKAQKLEFNGEFLLFREAKTKQPVLIVNDSLVYKGNAINRIAFKHTEYPAKLHEYKFFNIGAKTYLVHDGCGPVLEFRNDSIVRIDNSFLHRNQFGAIKFVYENEIYFFGGYGLFTTKNILTKFNFQTGEWLEVQTYGATEQEPRVGAFSYITGDNLYVFGGSAKDVNEVTVSKLLDNKVWRLNLTTMSWKCEGTYNETVLKKEHDFMYHDSKKIYFLGEYFKEYDFYSNKIHTNNMNFFPKIETCYLDEKMIIGVYRKGDIKFFGRYELNQFKGKLISTSNFISPIVNCFFYIMTSVASLLVVIILLSIYKQQLKLIFKPFKGILYKKQKDIFLYKNRPIGVFDKQEKKLLLYLIEQDNQFVSLNNLNQLFENNNLPESIFASVKRREQTVSRLLVKVSKITGIGENKLIIERKNSEDKRIKDIIILPNLLKSV